jgi:hypothetical protein
MGIGKGERRRKSTLRLRPSAAEAKLDTNLRACDLFDAFDIPIGRARPDPRLRCARLPAKATRLSTKQIPVPPDS